jgi:large subunit ribosomal protein L25
MRKQQDLVPAVVYGAGIENQAIVLEHKLISKALENEAFYSHILTLKVDGKKAEQVVLKDLQRHPYKPKIMHVDFLRVKASEKLTMHVPIHVVGEDVCVGIKLQGGVISRLATDVEIRCLPANLPEYIELDISATEIDTTLHFSDLNLPKGVEVVALMFDEPHDEAVLSIHKPHLAKEPEEGAIEAAPEEGEEEGGEAKEE